MKKLPIGIQTFRDIAEGDYIYVDKKDIAFDIIQNHRCTFLSRPRKFGKSIFLYTLHNIFDGNEELFRWLYTYGNGISI